MNIHLQYGTDGIAINLPDANTTIFTPTFLAGLPDEAASFQDAVRHPINAEPLRERIKASDKVAVVIPDLTRPLPTEKLLTWMFAELSHVPAESFTIINGTGSHRVNTEAELISMVGESIVKNYKIVNHNAHDAATLKSAGQASDGHEVFFNQAYVEADKRIVMGFIEPHFMAGFSGGYKGIFPAVADIASIMHYHRAEIIGHPRSTWGVIEGNPTQEIVRRYGSVLPVDFCLNVTQNRKREITRFFCGDVLTAHEQGCAFAKSTAMVAVPEAFPIVITTNSGYPLDQNLYQAVKGMSAGAQIVQQDGLILSAARCNDGFPAHGNFKKLLFDHATPQAMLDTILSPGFSLYDQWEAQLLGIIVLKAKTALLSEIPAEEVQRAFLEPITDIEARVAEELKRIGQGAPIAVLPEGPMTIPYLA